MTRGDDYLAKWPEIFVIVKLRHGRRRCKSLPSFCGFEVGAAVCVIIRRNRPRTEKGTDGGCSLCFFERLKKPPLRFMDCRRLASDFDGLLFDWGARVRTERDRAGLCSDQKVYGPSSGIIRIFNFLLFN